MAPSRIFSHCISRSQQTCGSGSFRIQTRTAIEFADFRSDVERRRAFEKNHLGILPQYSASCLAFGIRCHGRSSSVGVMGAIVVTLTTVVYAFTFPNSRVKTPITPSKQVFSPWHTGWDVAHQTTKQSCNIPMRIVKRHAFW